MLQNKTELLTCYNNAGFALFPLVGKVPAKGQKNWQDTPYDLGVDPSGFPENFAVVLGSDILVIDVDPRNFDQADKPHKRLFEDIEISFSKLNTFTVETGTGGLHIYLRIPPGTAIKKKNKNYKGIDFLAKGCYVVGAGSLHPDTKKVYKIINGAPEAIKDAPEILLNLIRQTMDDTAHVPSREYTDTKYDIAGYVKYLQENEPAVEGSGGDNQTYKMACQARNVGISPELCFQLMLEHYNPRCRPPWSPDELMQKVRNGYTFAQGEVGKDRPEKHFKATEEEEELIHIIWDTTANGTKKKILINVCNYFDLKESPLNGAVAFNEFSNRVCVMKRLPWHKPDYHVRTHQEWTNFDSIECRYYLNTRGFDVPTKLIGEAVIKVSRRDMFHPVKDYMTSLVWDGVPRLDTWLTTYCGVVDNKYTREVGRIALMQMAKRVYQPGCKADYVLVLEGDQGAKKSEVFRILAGEWFADFPIDPHATNTVDAMQGKLIVEFAEMDVTRRSDVSALKSFITRQVDRVRFAYAEKTADVPRQCVFMGTMNPDATNEYLADTTGNRRFFPVKVGVIQTVELNRDRDQVIAEAVQLVMKGVASWIVDDTILRMAEKEQEARQHSDPWQGSIEEFLEMDETVTKYKFTTTKDIWCSPFGLKGNAAQMTRFHSVRIHTVMKRIGWTYGTYMHPVKKISSKGFKLILEPVIDSAGLLE